MRSVKSVKRGGRHKLSKNAAARKGKAVKKQRAAAKALKVKQVFTGTPQPTIPVPEPKVPKVKESNKENEKKKKERRSEESLKTVKVEKKSAQEKVKISGNTSMKEGNAKVTLSKMRTHVKTKKYLEELLETRKEADKKPSTRDEKLRNEIDDFPDVLSLISETESATSEADFEKLTAEELTESDLATVKARLGPKSRIIKAKELKGGMGHIKKDANQGGKIGKDANVRLSKKHAADSSLFTFLPKKSRYMDTEASSSAPEDEFSLNSSRTNQETSEAEGINESDSLEKTDNIDDDFVHLDDIPKDDLGNSFILEELSTSTETVPSKNEDSWAIADLTKKIKANKKIAKVEEEEKKKKRRNRKSETHNSAVEIPDVESEEVKKDEETDFVTITDRKQKKKDRLSGSKDILRSISPTFEALASGANNKNSVFEQCTDYGPIDAGMNETALLHESTTTLMTKMTIEEIVPPEVFVKSCPCAGSIKEENDEKLKNVNNAQNRSQNGESKKIEPNKGTSQEGMILNGKEVLRMLMKQIPNGSEEKTISTAPQASKITQEPIKRYQSTTRNFYNIEAMARRTLERPSMEYLVQADADFCSYMLDTYGEDYEAMTLDKRNIYHDNATKMKRKMDTFRRSSFYPAYLASKSSKNEQSSS